MVYYEGVGITGKGECWGGREGRATGYYYPLLLAETT